ncbi:hypothetical protein SDJN03_30174, partial [Cucurbita argyrosperma subsp. sororia]
MMLASAKIDLPIQNELGFSLPVDLDSEVAPKGRDWLSFLCTSIEDKNKIRSKSCPSPEGDLSGQRVRTRFRANLTWSYLPTSNKSDHSRQTKHSEGVDKGIREYVRPISEGDQL